MIPGLGLLIVGSVLGLHQSLKLALIVGSSASVRLGSPGLSIHPGWQSPGLAELPVRLVGWEICSNNY